jgi:hypothetical protein
MKSYLQEFTKDELIDIVCSLKKQRTVLQSELLEKHENANTIVYDENDVDVQDTNRYSKDVKKKNHLTLVKRSNEEDSNDDSSKKTVCKG